MAEQKAKRFMEESGSEEASVYARNYSAHCEGITPEASVRVYDDWTTYDQDMGERYKGPMIVAEAVAAFFPSQRDRTLILDVACGTGMVAQELQKLGFQTMHGLDPSKGLLQKAREKGLYQKYFCCYVDNTRLPIDNGTYDCVAVAGGFGEGHIPTDGLYELARIVRPGGLVCLVMRKEYLEHVTDYRDRLEPTMQDMEAAGIWRMQARTVVANYSFNNDGVLFTFVVC